MRFPSLRRSRGLPLLLLVLSPALGGTVLPFLHPCPVDMPAAASSTSHHLHHPGPSAPSAPAGDHQGHTCTCIGCCLQGPAMEPSAPRVSLRVMADAVLPGRVSRDAALFLAPLASLLPPATAPPVA